MKDVPQEEEDIRAPLKLSAKWGQIRTITITYITRTPHAAFLVPSSISYVTKLTTAGGAKYNPLFVSGPNND